MAMSMEKVINAPRLAASSSPTLMRSSGGAQQEQASAAEDVLRDAPVGQGQDPFLLVKNSKVHAPCIVFHSRSEEAKQSNSVQKLALALLEADGAEHKSLPKLLQDEPDVSRDAEKYEQKLKNTRELMYAEEAAILDKVLLEADGAEHKSLPKLLQGEPNVSRDAEKYEQELKNTITRELMYAEEAAILDKLMDSGGKFGGSKKCYRVSGGLHGIGLLFVKIATTITLISILAQPVHADFFSIFGKLPYRSYGWDVKKSYETFHGGIFHSEGVLEKGAKYKGVDLMRWPQRVALPPRGWLLLEVNATGEDDRTTLAIRNDNLFIIAFANKAGQWFYFSGGEALLNEPATNAIRLPFTASYGPNGLGLSSFRGRKEEMMKSLVFGENEALEAMRTLSNFDIARSDTEATKGALLVMTLMVSEAQRFKKVSAPILEAWPTAVSLLEVEFLWYWGEVSCSMLTYLVKNEYPAANIRYAHKFGPAGVGTYDLALLTVDLLQFPYACLETNGILEEFNFMKPES